MRINKKLVPIKLHYFLRFSATASLSLFLPLIVRQKGVPPQTVGLLWTVLPFFTFFTNSASGSIADAFKIHRAVFLLSLVLLTVGSCSIYFLPSLEQKTKPVPNPAFPGILEDETLPLQNGEESSNQTFANEQLLGIANVTTLPVQKIFGIGKDNSSQTETHLSLSQILKTFQFWLVFLCLAVQFIGLQMVVIFSDAVCFKILGSERERYGRQRMWGTIGMGTFSLIIGALVDWYSEGLPHQDFLPAFIICMILMVLDIILVSRMNIPSASKESFDLAALKVVFKSPSTVVFLFMIFVFGFATGVNWTFRLIMVEDVAREYDPNFPFMKLLLGTMMTVETFGGELPFLFLSGFIIQRLRHVPVFVLCLLSLWARYSLYFFLINPWLFLMVELLNGPAYGLFDANMVSYGTSIAPSGTLTTIQAIIRAMFAAGQSTGSLTGGFLYQKRGGKYSFLVTSFIVLGFTLVYIIFHVVNWLLRRRDGDASPEEGDDEDEDASKEVSVLLTSANTEEDFAFRGSQKLTLESKTTAKRASLVFQDSKV